MFTAVFVSLALAVGCAVAGRPPPIVTDTDGKVSPLPIDSKSILLSTNVKEISGVARNEFVVLPKLGEAPIYNYPNYFRNELGTRFCLKDGQVRPCLKGEIPIEYGPSALRSTNPEVLSSYPYREGYPYYGYGHRYGSEYTPGVGSGVYYASAPGVKDIPLITNYNYIPRYTVAHPVVAPGHLDFPSVPVVKNYKEVEYAVPAPLVVGPTFPSMDAKPSLGASTHYGVWQ